jgi:hypothetical protein
MAFFCYLYVYHLLCVGAVLFEVVQFSLCYLLRQGLLLQWIPLTVILMFFSLQKLTTSLVL